MPNTAWVSEADQRAAKNIGGRMPERPARLDPVERAKTDPQSPYERIAAQLRHDILTGVLAESEQVPPIKEIAAQHGVSAATVHCAMELLKAWGLISSGRGRRTIVVRPPDHPAVLAVEVAPAAAPAAVRRQLLDLEIRRLGRVVKKITDAVAGEAHLVPLPVRIQDYRSEVIGVLCGQGLHTAYLDMANPAAPTN
jgi:integrase